MNVSYVSRLESQDKLKNQPTNSLDFIILITGAFNTNDKQLLLTHLRDCARVLKNGGVLFVQGVPEVLPELGVFLENHLTFKYWFAVESTTITEKKGLPSVHAAVMLFVKGNGSFNVKRSRLPHQYCKACKRTLKDWGGKSHLMHPDGYVISDVIKDIPHANNYEYLSKPLFDILLDMLDLHRNDKITTKLVHSSNRKARGFVLPVEGLPRKKNLLSEPKVQYVLPNFPQPVSEQNADRTQIPITPITHDNMFDVVHQGDAIEVLRQYPDESVDLAFADPPYNLDKNYTLYADGQPERDYIIWCNTWLTEYIRVLKSTGSLFLLNLPRWALHHANFLNERLHFQNWIVWDALSEPRGKIMPAHYALLFYTKHPSNFTFNYDSVSPIDARHYCLRFSCVRKRKKIGDDDKANLNDIWWDVHRIKHIRDRDYHPCQLPEPLMERIINLSTNPGDVVLDAFSGTGTTAVVALRLRRRYIAIDLDPNYVKITTEKTSQIKDQGRLKRESIRHETRVITKKALQLELRHLAMRLGRLPTQEDVKQKSQYDLNVFLEAFPTWGKAVKAAKLEIYF